MKGYFHEAYLIMAADKLIKNMSIRLVAFFYWDINHNSSITCPQTRPNCSHHFCSLTSYYRNLKEVIELFNLYLGCGESNELSTDAEI